MLADWLTRIYLHFYYNNTHYSNLVLYFLRTYPFTIAAPQVVWKLLHRAQTKRENVSPLTIHIFLNQLIFLDENFQSTFIFEHTDTQVDGLNGWIWRLMHFQRNFILCLFRSVVLLILRFCEVIRKIKLTDLMDNCVFVNKMMQLHNIY